MADEKKTKDEDLLLTGNYDDIQEYDNDLPKWWIQLFYATIAFSILYALYVHFSGAPSDIQTLASEISELKKVEAKVKAAQGGSFQDHYIIGLKNPEVIALGQAVYVAKCSPCHAQNGEGLVGPNLTDEYSLHGATPEAIYKTITFGVPAKGMLAWKGVLSDEDLGAVASYVYSIRNTNLPGKAAEGNKD